MKKPNCNCNSQLIEKVKTKNNLCNEESIFFQEQDLLSGSLSNTIIVEKRTFTKDGKSRVKKSHVVIIHSYCPFCGKPYFNTDN